VVKKTQGAAACRTSSPGSPAYLLGMAPKPYYRRWAVYLRGEKLGEVLAATERAACVRAIQRFRIKREDQGELQVRRAKQAELGAMPSRSL
jgi:hypothetical protein